MAVKLEAMHEGKQNKKQPVSHKDLEKKGLKSMVTLKPIKLLPARERVASALRKAIISKQITEGEVITLESTAQQLGVSVTPVREAFQILARDGLIDLRQNKGATVLGLNETTIREHYEIRAALESAACVLCCQKKGRPFCNTKLCGNGR